MGEEGTALTAWHQFVLFLPFERKEGTENATRLGAGNSNSFGRSDMACRAGILDSGEQKEWNAESNLSVEKREQH